MKYQTTNSGRRSLFVIVTAAVLLGMALLTRPVHAAACATPATSYGTDTLTVNVPLTSTYRVWSRIKPASASNDSYLLEVDGNSCYTVGGGSSIPANVWTWVNYQNGTTSSTIDVSLSAGQHTLKLIGNSASLMIDRLIFAADTSCVPTGTGDNCAPPVDTTPPTVAITSPTNGATVSATVNAAATANDDSGVAKVEFYIDGGLQSTGTTTPYAYSWNTTTVNNGSHSVTAKAFDAIGNTNADTVSVTVQNGDTQPPSAPTNLSATAPAYNKVNLTWSASTDNVGVTGYWVIRDGVTIAQVGAVTTYSDTTVMAGTTYSYQVKAYDAAGNPSLVSNTSSVTTPSPVVPDTTPPTAPSDLKAAAASSSQINLTWDASTDNIGVKSYSIYRGTGSKKPTKLITVTTASFGDANLKASTAYSYYVVATDAAGNVSLPSATVPATTLPVATTGSITGIVSDNHGKVVVGATVTINVHRKLLSFTTDSKGSYTISNLPAGAYSVRYAAPHYHSKSVRVVVTTKATTNNVTLIHR